AVAAASASAQNRRWADPYSNGVKAFESGKCGDAILQFERAIAVEPKAGANKPLEGVFGIDYFPYYYLALCYADLQQWDKAAQNLDKGRPTLTKQQTAKFNETETKIKLALAPPPPRTNPAFDNGVRAANSALASRNFAGAIRELDQLRTLDAAEYTKQ